MDERNCPPSKASANNCFPRFTCRDAMTVIGKGSCQDGGAGNGYLCDIPLVSENDLPLCVCLVCARCGLKGRGVNLMRVGRCWCGLGLWWGLGRVFEDELSDQSFLIDFRATIFSMFFSMSNSAHPHQPTFLLNFNTLYILVYQDWYT